MNYADSTRARLSDILPVGGERARFEYEYDFGDGWLHEVPLISQYYDQFGSRMPAALRDELRALKEGLEGARR